jgi:hypothetical protein
MAPATLTTERAVFGALRNTFEAPAYAVLPGVSNGTGSNARRVIDAVVMSLWPSRGLTLDGVEIKVSRNDFTRELANPAKQEDHFKYLDRFWLAVGDASIVRDGELPETWGLLVPAKTKLKVVKPAPLLKPEPLPRSMLAAILRRAHEHINSADLRAEIKAEVEEAVGEELERLRAEVKQRQIGQSMMQHASVFHRFAERSGVRFEQWNAEAIDQAADIVKALGVGSHRQLFAGIRYQAESQKRLAASLVEDADEILAELTRAEALPIDVAPAVPPEAPS